MTEITKEQVLEWFRIKSPGYKGAYEEIRMMLFEENDGSSGTCSSGLGPSVFRDTRNLRGDFLR